MMSSSFAYEDPLLRQNLNTTQKTKEIFKEMGRGMWRSGKGFGKVGALFAGIECVIESVRRHFTCAGCRSRSISP
jgi:import inner membrane translocase subunit TIM22